MIEAIIFDFDGLILDTETPDFRSWKETFELYGADLPLSIWLEYVGTAAVFDPYAYLAAQLDQPPARETVERERRRRDDAWLARQALMPGVVDYLQAARAAGIKRAIASSSYHRWVDRHLAALGLADWFDVVCCRDDVDGRSKPDPAVYLAAVEQLGVDHGRVLERVMNYEPSG